LLIDVQNKNKPYPMEGIGDGFVWARQVLEEATEVLIIHFPEIKRFVTVIVDTIFVPKIIAKQLAVAFALNASIVSFVT